MKKKKIVFFTGNRAEYGMQYPILRAIAADKRFQYYLIVSGAHLDNKFGNTIEEIRKDGFSVYAQVDITGKEDTLFDTAQSIGKCVVSLSVVLKNIKPDICIIYADRFESFAALIASTQMGIATAHVEGGDITEGGALDDMVRHAMTKLAHLHFTTNLEASERIIRMGEEPRRVFTVGFSAIDLIKQGNFAKPEDLEARYKINSLRPLVICTQHPIATEYDKALQQLQPVLNAMLRLVDEGVQVIMTFPNNDAGGMRISDGIKRFVKNKTDRIRIYKSLGRYDYHGLLNICGRIGSGACVGNSSSGIKETPAFGCPVVNIGDRQKGRLRAGNVIDVGYNANEIYVAVKKCLEDKVFRKKCQVSRNPYGCGDTGKKIVQILAKMSFDLRLIQKKMTY